MKIRYENSLADLVAFNRYHCEHSPTVRRTRGRVTWVLPFCILIFVVPLSLMERAPGLLAAGATFATLYALIAPEFFRRSIDRQARKLYSEGVNKSTLGEHELELTEGDLIERTLYGEQRTRLQAIERVVTDNGYSFVYLSAVMAHVIPHDAVLEGDYEVFIERIKQKTDETAAEPL
jgi:hypothetical protein